MSPYHLGPFTIGVHTLWLGVHGVLMMAVVIGLALLAGALWCSRRADATLVRRLEVVSLLVFLAFVALTYTGLVPDVAFEKGAVFSGTMHNEFGVFTANVTDDNLGAFTGPLLFDIMEHVPLVLPVLALLLWFWIRHHGRRVIEEPAARGATFALIGVIGFWIVAIGNIGVYLVKVLTFPYVR